MRSLNRSVGATVKRCASAFSIWKLSSGIRFLFHCSSCHGRPTLQSIEELADLLPHFGSPGKPMPVRANEAHEFVTLVDREHVVLRRSISPDVSNAIHE